MQAGNIDFSVIYNKNIKLKDKKIAQFKSHNYYLVT